MNRIIITAQLLCLVSANAWAGGWFPGAPQPNRGEQMGRRPGRHHHALRPVTFNVFCVYKAGSKKCHAGARFEKLVTFYGDEVEDVSNHPLNPVFEVECGGDLIYNDGARRFTDREGTRLQAQSGPYPAVTLPPGSLQDGRRRVDATLELREVTLHGSCFIYTGEP